MAGRLPVFLASLAIIAQLCGCAARDAELAERGRSELIGLSESDLRMCAGHPANEDKVPGGQIWMYEHGAASEGGITVAPVVPLVGAQIGQPSSGYCRTQLKLMGGKVVEVSYAGATDIWAARDAVCAPIIRNCLDYRKGKW